MSGDASAPHGNLPPMGKFREFIPVAAATIIIALCALIPLAVGVGDDTGLSDVRSAAASLGTTNQEGQSLQLQAQQEQKQLTEAIVASAKSGASVKDIARAVEPLLAVLGIPEESAIQGVQGIIAQAGAPQQQAPTPQAPATTKP
jgi:hypothetical protein